MGYRGSPTGSLISAAVVNSTKVLAQTLLRKPRRQIGLPKEGSICRAWRLWSFAIERNGGRAIAISDVGRWFKSLYFYPGVGLYLVTMQANSRLAT
jgi:hypothetical protein